MNDYVVACSLLALNFTCLFTSDRFIYKSLNRQTYFWSEKDLSISDFQGTPDPKSEISAIVFPRIVGKINKVYNYPPAIVFTSNESEKSWVNTSLFDSTEQEQKILRSLIAHEKLHLNITEIYTRKAQDSLNNMLFSTPFEKYDLIEYYYKQADSVQDVFDTETNHGLIKKKNDEWSHNIMSKLGS